MKFDMNAAWREATGMIAANREVLMIVAGVFFLLPSLASVWFMSDIHKVDARIINAHCATPQPLW